MTTTQNLSPVTTVTAIYEAFGRGDVPTILSMLADDVVFDDDSLPSAAQSVRHPLLSAHRGKEGVAAFFTELGNYTFHNFQVTDVLAGNDVVAARVIIDVAYPSGVRIRDDEMHLWRFDADGLVTGMRHYADTAKHLAAWER